MEFKTFIKINLKEWNKYLKKLYTNISQGKIQLGTGILLYLNIAKFTETEDHYILELLGATRYFDELIVKRHKESSTLKYLYQFNTDQEEPTFNFPGRNCGIKHLLISRDADYEILKKRFNFSEIWLTKMNIKGGSGAVLSFKNDFRSCYINRCLLVNKCDEIYRVKYILHMEIISKTHSRRKYLEDLFSRFNLPWYSTDDLYGVHYIPSENLEGYMLSGQFTNIFLLPGLRETTIGKFLEKHPDFIRRAFSCKGFLYEHEFEWIEGNSDPAEKCIKPDLMLERYDGFFDICDLKTAALDKIRITKGKRRRRQFINYVDNGIAQLAHYDDYFKYGKNKEHAQSKYNVKVENPTLYLLVGSYENASKKEIEEASRKLKPQYKIIDYDTLNSLFLNSYARAGPNISRSREVMIP